MNILQVFVLQAPAAPAGAAGPAEGGSNIILIAYALMFAAFYFFVIAPQRKQQKEIRKFQEELSVGSSVLTSGGIFGKVVQISDNKVTLQVSEGSRIVFLKSAILSLADDNAKVGGQAGLN